MAKAALNRLTQTVGADVGKDGVCVVAVDPGWVSLMGIVPSAPTGNGEAEGGAAGAWTEKMRKRMEPPLSEEDGAARVLDPVFCGLKGICLWQGVLLRDFKVASW
ncbi:hypothetical protein HK104_011427 [Borealophlyctis nickersoniae]|nr:hypothetical protein HK104_011427 [Borealophlyctis nickersoniae]